MKNVRYEHQRLDVACDLGGAEEINERAEEWRRLRETGSRGPESITDGARLRLPADAWDAAVDLCRREASCCGFLEFELATDEDELWLDVTSPVPEARQVIACLVGLQADGAVGCC
jgi:hypothetical protein